MQEELYGIFIDGDNMNPKYFDILHNVIKKRGKIIMKKVYGDFTEINMNIWKKICLEYGIDGIMVWRDKNKNSSDIKMIMDLMDILYSFPHLNNFVIVSGDIDFKEICKKIISANKTVIGISCFEKSTSKNLKNFCSEFIILNNMKPTNDDKSLILQHINDILISENSQNMNLGLLKTRLLNINSCFNELNYGYKSFKDFIKSFEPQIHLLHKNNNYFISTESTLN
jgi:uncharacterized LabA/DUF88 family protein